LFFRFSSFLPRHLTLFYSFQRTFNTLSETFHSGRPNWIHASDSCIDVFLLVCTWIVSGGSREREFDRSKDSTLRPFVASSSVQDSCMPLQNVHLRYPHTSTVVISLSLLHHSIQSFPSAHSIFHSLDPPHPHNISLPYPILDSKCAG